MTMTVKFESKGNELLIDGKKVLKAWESFNGFYWFAVKRVQIQDSVMGDGKVIKGDTIWYGFVQAIEDEWGDFSEGEIKSLGIRAWQIPHRNLPYSGRRN